MEQTGMDLSGAAMAKLLLVSYRKHNSVRWFSAANGEQAAEASVPEPVAVAAMADGTALVISRGAVVAVHRDGNPPRTIIAANLLQNPWRLCVSPTSGDIFVAENSTLAQGAIERPEKNFESGAGQDLSAGVITKVTTEGQHHQVKRFSAEGKLLASSGRPDGRQEGVYVPTDFRGITDIETDYEGGFVVTEGHQQPPRRSARFDAHGKLLHEWLGAQEYGALSFPEPGNSEYVWYHANATPAGFVRCWVDYAKKSWSVVETYRDSLARNALWRNGNTPYRSFTRNGRSYFAATGFGTLGTLIYDREQKTLRVANLSGRAFRDDRWQIPEALRPANDQKPKAYLWNDLNDDGLPPAGGNGVDGTIPGRRRPGSRNPGTLHDTGANRACRSRFHSSAIHGRRHPSLFLRSHVNLARLAQKRRGISGAGPCAWGEWELVRLFLRRASELGKTRFLVLQFVLGHRSSGEMEFRLEAALERRTTQSRCRP